MPAGLSDRTTAAVQHSIKLAFVDSFGLLSWIVAGICCLGAALGAFGFGGRPVATTEEGTATPRRGHWLRWWIYQRERFPLLGHGPLIAAFSFSAAG